MFEAQRRQPQPMEKVDFPHMGRIGRTDNLEHLAFGSAVAEIRDRPVVEAAFVTFAVEASSSKSLAKPSATAVRTIRLSRASNTPARPCARRGTFEQRAMRRGAVMQAGMNPRDVELMSP
jgi:hypothetical protein